MYDKGFKGFDMALKDTLFNYLAQRHFDLMPPDTRDRFDDYCKNGDFIGHMKHWYENYTPDGPSYSSTPDLSALTDAEWEKLYDECQATMQAMDDYKNDSVGFGKTYKKATLNFISRWFGNDNQTFSRDTATANTRTTFTELAGFLRRNPSLKLYLSSYRQDLFTKDLTYEDFCRKLTEGKYNTDKEFRGKVESVIDYIRGHGPKPGEPEPDRDWWPMGVGYTMVTPPAGTPTPGPVVQLDTTTPDRRTIHDIFNELDNDPEKWYTVQNKDLHIRWFKSDWTKFFDEILASSEIRKDFLEKADGNVKTALTTAIKDTDYENTESDDYVPPQYADEKNWRQKLKKWGNDTYENHFRRFTNPSRGTRIFFSPYSQNFMKAFDKVGIKPTEGLEGILKKKDDPKLQNIINGDPTTRKHFKWFIETLELFKKETPDVFEGALRNGTQMRTLVSNLIVKAAKDKKMDEAKTALEVLSVAKYGLSSSNTVEALRKMDVNLFGNDKNSYMKNEGIAMIAKAADRFAKGIIVGAGAIGAGIYNFAQHRRTKIKKDIRKNKILNEAYTKWVEEDEKRHQDLRDSNAEHNIAGTFADLENSARAPVNETTFRTNYALNAGNIAAARTMLAAWQSGTAPGVAIAGPDGTPATPEDLEHDIQQYDNAVASGNTAVLTTLADATRTPRRATAFKTNYVINAGNLEATKAMLEAWRAGTAPGTAIAGPGGAPATPDDLENDITLFEDTTTRQKRDDEWRDDNPDYIHDLVAYWNMLESYGKTHTFTLGSMKVKRKAMLDNWKDKTSRAQVVANNYINGFGSLTHD